ncbi:hypothetical protein Kpho02_14880 [Kitasatospora phosalacinea]|uniref:Ankyrin n=1 Tax=Kitasatospora phosalacinea TaxID=2065 RepID=A0A9W6Q5Z5_9ACTN|nr:hypothetical protein [Kitasatospora phosalacinea]GLW69189.1 hypothetical protein Kpho02_14880 [Kitasatospora phosalacinea]
MPDRSTAGAPWSGPYETHLTLAPAEADALAAWAAAHGLEFTHILLARGRHPSQPMLSWRAEGTLAAQHRRAAAESARLRGAGFTPVRVKIEAAPWTPGVPRTDAEAERADPAHYFEHHVKVRLSPGTPREALARAARGHHAHVSWNARRTEPGGHRHYFVTQRCHRVGLTTATARLTRLATTLTTAGFPPLKAEREYVVHDSALALDAGWLDGGPAEDPP